MRSYTSHRNSGFTLIELLVVIAIIAILAAILFPVFAQAREKARGISCVSNEKQINLAILMYSEDYDETYPESGLYYDFSLAGSGWPDLIAPYIKSLQVFWCPDDSGPTGGETRTGGGFNGGPMISYVANGLMGGGIQAATSDNTCVGVICGNPYSFGYPPSGAFAHMAVMSVAGVTAPAQTIAFTELFSSDVQHGYLGFLGYNTSDVWPVNMLLWDCYPGAGDCFYYPGGQIPEGVLPASNPYPTGQAGGVSVHHTGTANVAFADGHVKAMRPEATNPDGVNQPQNNMYNATRSLQ